MSTSVSSEVSSSVDLSQLLTFNVGFKNLELVLRTLLTRMDNVEEVVATNHHTSVAKDDELTDAIEDLKRQLEEQKDIQAGLSARCNELAEQVAVANRAASDALEASEEARRKLSEVVPPQTVVVASQATPVAAPPAKDYSEEIAALQKSVDSLMQAKADKKQVEDERKILEQMMNDGLEAANVACDRVDADAKARDADLQARLDALQASVADANAAAAAAAAANQKPAQAPAAPSNEWLGPVSKLNSAVDHLKAEQDAVHAKLAALAGLGSQHTTPTAGSENSGVSAAQFALLSASVSALEKRPLPKDYDSAIELLNQQLRALGNEVSINTTENKRLDDTKANKDDLSDLAKRVASLKSSPSPLASAVAPVTPTVAAVPTSAVDSSAWTKPVADANRRIDELVKQVSGLEALLRSADAHKLSTERSVQNLSDEVDRLRAALDDLKKKIGPAVAAGPAVSASSAADQVIVKEMQQQLGEVLAETAKHVDWTKGQVLEIRATIEHIHHTKADTALVANKAEREFVENSMEKLMREVEQVLNATNAGLIDTLDKSLNILRDMIDGKATKQDVIKLQSMIGEEQLGGGNVPEGLTGFKGYRCLGCNRTMDGMRQRPMGANFSTFMNRLPPNSSTGASAARPVSQQQPAIGTVPSAGRISGPSPPAGYIGNVPQSR